MDPFDLRLWNGFERAGGDLSQPAIIDQISIDSRRLVSQNALFVPLPGTMHDGHHFISHVDSFGARYSLVHNDWKQTQPLSIKLLRVDDPLKALQEIAKTYRQQFTCQVIAIIGSYGKTMVKDLLQAILKNECAVIASPESFNSQIGVPLSLLTIRKEHKIALIEAAFSKLGEIKILADIILPTSAILTHVGKKHLPTLGDLKQISSEMFTLLHSLPQEGWALIPHDVIQHVPQLKAKHYFWNQESDQLPNAKALSLVLNGIMPYEITFPDHTHFQAKVSFGFYYYLDLLNIATKAAWLLNTPSKAICQALSIHAAEPTRTEIWQSPTGITFINDTYCSDPQSIDRAFKHFDQMSTNKGDKIFVFSGIRVQDKFSQMDMLYKHIGQRIGSAQLESLVLVGHHPFAALIDEIKRLSPQTSTHYYATHKEAYQAMDSWVKQHDTVLIKGDKKQSLDQLTEAFNDSVCSNQCFINLAAIQANISAIRNKVGVDTRIMVMVKAYAYGTNDVRMAKFLATCNVDILGVSYVDEAVALRRSGVTQEIFAINAALYEMAKVIKWNLQIGVNSSELVLALAKEATLLNKKIKIHIHVDTGMSRLGCRPEEALTLAKLIKEQPSLILEGIMTHFACADNPKEDAFTLAQIRCFDRVITEIEQEGITLPWKHAANSSAVLRFNLPQYNMVRVGLAVYGLHPSPATRQLLELELALTLTSRIVGVNHCHQGETVSYGRNYLIKEEEQKIAVLPIGYFDGLHRNYSGKGEVLIRGIKAPMVGNICMDFMMVDVTSIPDVAIGDSVLIFGEDEYGNYLSPEELATNGDSIIHELMTCLGPRIHRFFIYEEASHTTSKIS